jgi:hypothetical protein
MSQQPTDMPQQPTDMPLILQQPTDMPVILKQPTSIVSHIKCSTARHERGWAGCPRREQGNSTKVGCSQNPINCSEPFHCRIFLEKRREAWTFRVSRPMDQKPIVLYLWMKGMAPDAIHDDLVRTLGKVGKDAVAYSTVTKYVRSAQFSGRKEATLPKLQMWSAILSMRPILTALPESPFPFRLCTSFREGSVFRDPPCTGTSRNHVASRCGIFYGSPTFDGGTEADSGPDGNRTITRPLSAKHAPVARHCHLGRVVDLFVQ